MRTSWISAFVILLGGCSVSTRQNAMLTAEQAQKISVRLASEKAGALYHCRPFVGDEPARFAQGRWVWTGRQGYGHLDIQATVELAANGSTNGVDVKLLDARPVL
jgi:hypothetical protein